MASDKLTIKNLLFTKTVPNYIANVAAGRKTYLCTDCGDKYVFESSYNMHINRQSLKITYMCRHCGQKKIFLNRCKLLSHIRSHSFKTATINVSDFNIEPLPLEYFHLPPTIGVPDHSEKNLILKKPTQLTKFVCPHCNKNITDTGILYKDRANHYMKFMNNTKCYPCPICLFTLPNLCALKTHLQIHLRVSPLVCPECGVHISHKSVIYPYNHDCEGFETMRATTRLKCKINNCTNFHPNNYKEHMKGHIVTVYKCTACPATWLDEPPKKKHLQCQNTDGKIVKCFKCPICPDSNKLFSSAKLERHMRGHFNSNLNIMDSQVYPCQKCTDVFDQVHTLLTHQIKKHGASKNIFGMLAKPKKNREVFVVIKRCDKCQRNFKYKCPFDQINTLPNECPYKCSSVRIKCFVCRVYINAHWVNIKNHFATFHKEHKCVDIKVNLRKLDANKPLLKTNKDLHVAKKFKSAFQCSSIKESSENIYDNLITAESKLQKSFRCSQCKKVFENKKYLENHIVSHHRDLSMAYQCLECGQCYAVKPSFSTHLLMEHQITDVDGYISSKQCFNGLAFIKNQNINDPIDEGPIQENQCRICREKFDDNYSLEKHFRVHGMAFLMDNAIKS